MLFFKREKQCVPSFYCCKYVEGNCYGRLAREMLLASLAVGVFCFILISKGTGL